MNKNWIEEAMKPEHRGTWLALFLAAGFGYLLYGMPNKKEISWQEFRTRYLDTGEVRREGGREGGRGGERERERERERGVDVNGLLLCCNWVCYEESIGQG